MLHDDVPPCENTYIVNAHVLEAEQYSGITTGWWAKADKDLRDQLAKQRVRKDSAKIVNKGLKKDVNQGKIDEKEKKRIEKTKREADALEKENKRLRGHKASLTH